MMNFFLSYKNIVFVLKIFGLLILALGFNYYYKVEISKLGALNYFQLKESLDFETKEIVLINNNLLKLDFKKKKYYVAKENIKSLSSSYYSKENGFLNEVYDLEDKFLFSKKKEIELFFNQDLIYSFGDYLQSIFVYDKKGTARKFNFASTISDLAYENKVLALGFLDGSFALFIDSRMLLYEKFKSNVIYNLSLDTNQNKLYLYFGNEKSHLVEFDYGNLKSRILISNLERSFVKKFFTRKAFNIYLEEEKFLTIFNLKSKKINKINKLGTLIDVYYDNEQNKHSILFLKDNLVFLKEYSFDFKELSSFLVEKNPNSDLSFNFLNSRLIYLKDNFYKVLEFK